MYHNPAKNADGYVAVLAVLLVGALVTLISVHGVFRSYELRYSTALSEQHQRAAELAHSCGEVALLKLVQDVAYSGDETITIVGETCSIVSVTGSGPSDRIVTATSTVGTVTQAIRIDIANLVPRINIASWNEISL